MYKIEDFINKANIIHNNKYSYTKTDLEHRDENGKVIITCPIHGDFRQKPKAHLNGKGCQYCAGNHKYTVEEFKEEASAKHNDKYDYSLITSLNRNVSDKREKYKVPIICKKHGVFKQNFHRHLLGKGCNKCAHEYVNNLKKKPLNEFIEELNIIHSNTYTIDESTYNGWNNKVSVFCPKHGKFEMTPNNLLRGHGCPKCSSSLLEKHIINFLVDNNIKYINGATKSDIKWIGNQHLDFYLPDYNIAIECQGE